MFLCLGVYAFAIGRRVVPVAKYTARYWREWYSGSDRRLRLIGSFVVVRRTVRVASADKTVDGVFDGMAGKDRK
jgi:hypothetical protein